MKPALWLMGLGCVPGAIAVVASLAGWMNLPIVVPIAATAVTVLPGALTLAMLHWLRRRPESEQIAFLMVGTAVRMGAAIVGGIAAFYLFEGVRTHPLSFAGLALALYLACLGLELFFGTRLLAAGPDGRRTQTGSP